MDCSVVHDLMMMMMMMMMMMIKGVFDDLMHVNFCLFN